jgi:opacity protein-like surface antigen
VEEIGTGWYLRGDVGYSRGTKPSISYWPNDGLTALSNGRLEDNGIIGLGFGYKFNEWLRTDVTVEHLRQGVKWDRVGDCYGFGNGCPTYASNNGTLAITPVLANLYVDLGNFGGITPYIGAGVGFATVAASQAGWRGAETATSIPGDSYSTYEFSYEGYTSISLAAAGMAGFSWDLGSGFQLDLGYRYLWVQKARGGITRSRTTTITNPDPNANPAVEGGTVVNEFVSEDGSGVRYKDLGLNQVRIGLRYFVY